MSREYLDLSFAFGRCFQTQTELGRDLVAAINRGMYAIENGGGAAAWVDVRRILKEMRAGRRTLARLRKRIRELSRRRRVTVRKVSVWPPKVSVATR